MAGQVTGRAAARNRAAAPPFRGFQIALFLLPALVIYVLFMAIPLLGSLRMSFYQWAGGTSGEHFVGLANFHKLLFTDPFRTRFWNALKNNVEFFGMTMIFQNLLALGIAVVLTRGLKGSGFFRTIFFAPVTLSVLLVGFVWTLILNPNWGVLNQSLKLMHLSALAKGWLGDPKLALPIIAIVNAWQYIGLPTLIFVAAIQAIPEELFEAARIDGANRWRIFWHVTVPGIPAAIGLVTLLTFVGDFSSFEIIYAMEGTMAGPQYHTDVMGTFFYRTAFSSYTGAPPDLGVGAAIAALTFVLITVGVVVWMYLDNRRQTA